MKEWKDRNKVVFVSERLFDRLMETKMLYNRESGIGKVSVGSIIELILNRDELACRIYKKLCE